MSETYEDPFGDMTADTDVMPLAAFGTIPLRRVTAFPADEARVGAEDFHKMGTASAADGEDIRTAFPGFDYYADLVGGRDNFCRMAKEGNEFKWLEAFAAAEAFRNGALSGVFDFATPGRFRPVDVGYGDAFDDKRRPYDVKTVPPGDIPFDVGTTIGERLYDKGGYLGLDDNRYPAVLILDVSFVTPERLAALNGEIAAIFQDPLHPERAAEAWRVIEVCVAYKGEELGFAAY